MLHIVNRLFIFIFVLYLSVGFAFGQEQVSWEQKYGEGLINVPLPWQQQFELANGIAWGEATLEEQYGFLNQLLAQKKERAKAKEIRDQREQAKKLARVEQAKAKEAVKAAKAAKKLALEQQRASDAARRQQKLAEMTARRQALMGRLRSMNK